MALRVALVLALLGVAPASTLALTGSLDPMSDPAMLGAVGSLAAADTPNCNATRIRTGWAITARHCVDEASAPLTFATWDGRRIPVARAVSAPKGDDVALLQLTGDDPAAPGVDLLRPPTECSTGAALANASRIISFRHGAQGSMPRSIEPVQVTVARTIRDCSLPLQEITLISAADGPPAPFSVCTGDSGSPVLADGPAGAALRGVLSAAFIDGDGTCSNTQPTGSIALADTLAPWIDQVTATPPRPGALRISRARPAGARLVAIYGVRPGAVARGPVKVTWLRNGRAVLRRTAMVRTEWRPLMIPGPALRPGRYRVQMSWSGGRRTSNAFTLAAR